jgi:hypothetical protein
MNYSDWPRDSLSCVRSSGAIMRFMNSSGSSQQPTRLLAKTFGVSWSNSLDAAGLMHGIKKRCAWIAYVKDHQP